MAKKKSSRKPVKKMKEVLDTQFSCLFCNHEKSVICELDKKTNIGTLRCKTCGQMFQTLINGLSQPVDVYSDWVDACEAVAEDAEKNGGGSDGAEAGVRVKDDDDEDGGEFVEKDDYDHDEDNEYSD